MRDCDDHLVVGIEVFGVEIAGGVVYVGAALVAVFLTNFDELVANHVAANFGVVEDGLEEGDFFFNRAVVVFELVLLEGGKVAETHLDDGLSLGL